MTGKMGGKSQQRKWGTQKRKKRKIRVMKNQMRSRGMIKTMAQEICLAHPQQKNNRQSPQQESNERIRGKNQ
jgi:hypothetical protein